MQQAPLGDILLKALTQSDSGECSKRLSMLLGVVIAPPFSIRFFFPQMLTRMTNKH